MPTCKKCRTTQASAEMRKSPKDGWLCKDRISCRRRENVLRKTEQRMMLHMPEESPVDRELHARAIAGKVMEVFVRRGR